MHWLEGPLSWWTGPLDHSRLWHVTLPDFFPLRVKRIALLLLPEVLAHLVIGFGHLSELHLCRGLLPEPR